MLYSKKKENSHCRASPEQNLEAQVVSHNELQIAGVGVFGAGYADPLQHYLNYELLDAYGALLCARHRFHRPQGRDLQFAE